jgi:hypothetical protein
MEWISVKDRTPDDDTLVLVYMRSCHFSLAFYIGKGRLMKKGFWEYVGCQVELLKNPTHWMPLPEPPK